MPAWVPLAIAGASLAGKYMESQGQASAATAQADAQRRALAQAQQAAESGYSDISQLYNPYTQAGQKAFQQYGEQDFSYDPGQFEYGQSLGDFMDPSMQFQMDQAMQGIQGSAAAGGSLGSGATLKAMQDRGQQVAQMGYGQAHDRMMQDKNFAYNQFLTDANARRAQLAQQENQLLNVANTGFQATQQQAANRGNLAGVASGIAQQGGNVMAPGYASGMQQAGMAGALSDPNMIGSVMGAFGGGGGGGSVASQNQGMAAAPNYYGNQGLA